MCITWVQTVHDIEVTLQRHTEQCYSFESPQDNTFCVRGLAEPRRASKRLDFRLWKHPGEPFDHKKRAHTALVHKKIFSRPYAVFTAIRIAVYNFTFFTVSTAIQRFSTAKCALFHGQILFSRPYLDSKAKPFFRSHLAKRPLAFFFAIKLPPRMGPLSATEQKGKDCHNHLLIRSFGLRGEGGLTSRVVA